MIRGTLLIMNKILAPYLEAKPVIFTPASFIGTIRIAMSIRMSYHANRAR